MPEGPEARLIADLIQKAVGFQFNGCYVPEQSLKYKKYALGVESQRAFDTNMFSGINKLVAVQTKGKLIELVFRQVDKEENVIHLLSSLGMTGTWTFNQSNHRHCRFVLYAADQTKDVPGIKYGAFQLCFLDQRNFGNIRLVSAAEAAKLKSKIGMDILELARTNYNPNYSLAVEREKWFNWVLSPKNIDKPLPELLLDQSCIAGIGNYLRAEILFRAGVGWQTPRQCQINRSDDSGSNRKALGAIFNKALAVTYEAYKLGGCSLKNFEVEGKKGDFQNHLNVYGKSSCPLGHWIAGCPDSKGRMFWWCPQCQTTDTSLIPKQTAEAELSDSDV